MIYFPSQEDPLKWPDTLRMRLPDIRPDHLAVVEKHQPYQWKTNARHHPLARLAHLSREDKHRRIVLVIGKNVQYSLRLKQLVGWTRERVETPPTPLNIVQVGTEMLRIYGRPVTTEPEIKVDMDAEGATTIAFENGAQIMDTLNQIGNAVKMIRDELTPLF